MIDGGISGWNDKSGKERHFVQNVIARRPTVLSAELNALDVASFDGVDDCVINNTDNAKNIFTNVGYSWVIVVCKKRVIQTTNVGRTVFDVAGGPVGDNPPLHPSRFSPYINGLEGGESLNYGCPQHLVRRFDGETAGFLNDEILPQGWVSIAYYMRWVDGTGFLYQNGALTASKASMVTAGNTQDTLSGRPVAVAANINRFGTPGLCADFDLAELIVGTTELTLDLFYTLTGYLHHKWGMADLLPPTHPYKSSPPPSSL
jgi:hypothetical protein